MSQLKREQLRVAAERAVLAAVHLPGAYVDKADPFSELRSLAETAGASVVGELMQNLPRPRGRTYLGNRRLSLKFAVSTTRVSPSQ